MTRTMYDGVTAKSLPTGASLYAGYVDGTYYNVPAIQSRFPHTPVVGIAVTAHYNGGIVLDVEKGDATPGQAPGWVKLRRAAGVDPTIYCNSSTWPEVRTAFAAAKVALPHFWIAHWDGSPTIPAGAVAKQYKDDGGYDVSSVAAYWPGVDPLPKMPGKTVPYKVIPHDTMTAIAAHHHVTLAALEKANPQVHDPNLIYPGQILHIPA